MNVFSLTHYGLILYTFIANDNWLYIITNACAALFLKFYVEIGFDTTRPNGKARGFPSGHVWIWSTWMFMYITPLRVLLTTLIAIERVWNKHHSVPQILGTLLITLGIHLFIHSTHVD